MGETGSEDRAGMTCRGILDTATALLAMGTLSAVGNGIDALDIRQDK